MGSGVHKFNSAQNVTPNNFNHLTHGTLTAMFKRIGAMSHRHTKGDDMKAKLIEKFLERYSDLEIQELAELVHLDIHQVVEDAVTAKLNEMSEDQVLELL